MNVGGVIFDIDFWGFGNINKIFSIALLTFYVYTTYIFIKTSMKALLKVYLCMEEITESLQQ